jgi:hypothetical protein
MKFWQKRRGMSYLQYLIEKLRIILEILILRSRNSLFSFRSSYQDVTIIFIIAIYRHYHGKNLASRQ